MFIDRHSLRLFSLGAVLVLACVVAAAQSPTGTPPADPKAPPGTQQTSPTAPPGTQQTSPTAPPGTNPTQNQEPAEPKFPQTQPRPMPSMPNLTRLGVNSGNILTLSLSDAVKKALENNNDIEVARHDVRFAETQLRSLEGIYEPIFAITPQIDRRIIPVQNIFAGGGTSGQVATTTLSFNPSVSKQFSTGGGNYQATFSNSRTTTSATNSTLNPYYSSNLSLSFTQPLLRNRSIDNSRHQIRIQKKRLEQSDADFRRRTIDVISQVQSAYWDLVFAQRDQQIQLDNLNLSRENLRQIEAQITAGAKAPLDRAEVLTEIATRETTLLTATQTVSIAENALKQLIFKDPTSADWS